MTLNKARRISFSNHMLPIDVCHGTSNSKIYAKCNWFEKELHTWNWHEIKIYHPGLEYHVNPKQAILRALLDAVDGKEFYPVAYSEGKRYDSFLVRDCMPALENLFKAGLTITMSTGACLSVTVQFNVAEYKRGQVSPNMLITQKVNECMAKLKPKKNASILNLSKFNCDDFYFEKVEISLYVRNTFLNVCQSICLKRTQFREVQSLNLANNDICDAAPLALFSGAKFKILDLSNNRFRSASSLCAALANVKAYEIKLANNPLTKSSNYPDCLKSLETNFKLVDGMPFATMHKSYTPLSCEINLKKDGTRIDWRNKQSLAKFKRSRHWHAVIVPDAEHLLTERILLDYFFICLKDELSEFYPCYYTYSDGQHSFIVRECFDQLHHLVWNCKTTLKIRNGRNIVNEGPRLFRPKTSIAYALRMNVGNFKRGHVEPKICIKLALENRFSKQQQLLDLEHFQQSKCLQKIIINMSSSKTIMGILSMASQMFKENCTEIRLGGNRIVGLNYMDGCYSLLLLTNLHTLDLSNNWIQDMGDIKPLGKLPIKSVKLIGNPVCNKYPKSTEYFKAAQDVFPQLTHLDGVHLAKQNEFSGAIHQTFLVNKSAHEVIGNDFLKTFLNEFEKTNERSKLCRFYYQKSIFTMTCNCDIDDASETTRKCINQYRKFSRNILNLADPTQDNNLFVGKENILKVLMLLPNVKHDFDSLYTDVMKYDNYSAVLCVMGVLRDESIGCKTRNELIMGFSRQFVLKLETLQSENGSEIKNFIIKNDRLNLMTPTPNQVQRAFSYYCTTDKEIKLIKNFEVNNEMQKTLELIEYLERAFNLSGRRPKTQSILSNKP